MVLVKAEWGGAGDISTVRERNDKNRERHLSHVWTETRSRSLCFKQLTLASWRLVQNGSGHEGRYPAPALGSPDTHTQRIHTLSDHPRGKKQQTNWSTVQRYLLAHGHASWGDDHISTTDPLVESREQVVRAADTKMRKRQAHLMSHRRPQAHAGWPAG